MPFTGRVRRLLAGGGLALGAVALLTLALAAGPGLASSKATAYYPGTTSQDKTLALSLEGKNVNVTWFGFDSPPCGGPGGTQYAGLQAKLKKNGKFKAAPSSDYGYVKGKLKGRKFTGTARHTLPELGCDSGVVTWTAKKE